jgi:hypothetical protein
MREDNIKMDHKGIRCEGVDWINLAQNKDHRAGWCNDNALRL